MIFFEENRKVLMIDQDDLGEEKNVLKCVHVASPPLHIYYIIFVILGKIPKVHRSREEIVYQVQVSCNGYFLLKSRQPPREKYSCSSWRSLLLNQLRAVFMCTSFEKLAIYKISWSACVL